MLLLKNLLFTILVPGTVAGYLPFLLSRAAASPSRLTLLASAPFFLLGAAIYAWCLWDFATFGRGTPAPVDAPKRLVVRGLYRCSRNPMYVGVLTAILGWVVLRHTTRLVWYALVVFLFFHAFVLLYEEPKLTSLFGGEYRDYCKRVHRWIGRHHHSRPAS